ncbi:hypothetical protein K7W42_21155 [Deinococcus sp. HMF7604]|uniref:hypothetical protein n=1 Tax=Deinococcus betulae TaxID=2873312 RepID=UPI001CCB27AD|nr:hypothetical protein [Deinococcus betulae]MBZ9753347.1 hypothetical protein [Deinococcus betulae]
MLNAMAEMLERCGHSPDEARLIAADMLQRQADVVAGCSWGGVHAEFLVQLWAQATHGGNKRRLLLEVTAEGNSSDEYHGHIRVEVKEAQTWADFDREQREARDRAVN